MRDGEMGDAEFGDALVFTQSQWFWKTVHRQCRNVVYASVVVIIMYVAVLWDTDHWWPTFPMSMSVLAAWAGGYYGMVALSLHRSPSKPGLYERGLVSILRERVRYSDVTRIELHRQSVHVLYSTEEEDGCDGYAYFPRDFITDEGVEKVRIQANLLR